MPSKGCVKAWPAIRGPCMCAKRGGSWMSHVFWSEFKGASLCLIAFTSKLRDLSPMWTIFLIYWTVAHITTPYLDSLHSRDHARLSFSASINPAGCFNKNLCRVWSIKVRLRDKERCQSILFYAFLLLGEVPRIRIRPIHWLALTSRRASQCVILLRRVWHYFTYPKEMEDSVIWAGNTNEEPGIGRIFSYCAATRLALGINVDVT